MMESMVRLLALLFLAAPAEERLLLGPHPYFRREGMERARARGDVDLLRRAAASPHWDARRLAALGLGKEAPLALLEDPAPEVRAAALRALGPDTPRDAAARLLADPDGAVRLAAAWALAGSARPPSALAVLAREDPSPEIRAAALAARDEWAPLRREAAGGDPAVAVPALAALGRAGGAAESRVLFDLFRRALDDDEPLFFRARPHTSLAVARALADAARRGVDEKLAARIARAAARADLEGPAGVLAAAAAAGTRDVALARRVLAAQQGSPERLAASLHALARDPWPELAGAVLFLLEHEDWRVRLAVVGALDGDAAIPALRDAHPLVRAAACARVRRAASLADAARDGSPVVAAAAARALGRAGDARALLESLFARPEPSVRRAAVAALFRESAVETLERAALHDEAEDVRATARAALALLDDPGTAPRAVSALGHEELAVRTAARDLLHALTDARHAYDPEDPADGVARWRDWLARRDEHAAREGGFRYHVEELRRRGLDLVLVFDATGSMASVLQGVKRRMAEWMGAVRDLVPGARVRIVAFRDAEDAFSVLASPIVRDPRLAEDFLSCVPAYGGGDAPESLLAGLREAILGTPWSDGASRVVVLFGDAPGHPHERPLLEATLREFDGVVHAVDTSRGGTAGFSEMAAWGRGRAVSLRDDADLLRELLVLALGAEHREAIEALFGL